MMKQMFKFNMIEIALAIAIIAIGLSSLLVLFPIGINATRSAMDENSHIDAMEYITRYVRSQTLNHWETQSATAPDFFDKDYPKYQTAGKEDTLKTLNLLSDDKWTAVTNYPELKYHNLSGCGYYYKFTRTGYNGEEIFSAYIKIWDVTAKRFKETGSTAGAGAAFFVYDITETDATKAYKQYKDLATNPLETGDIETQIKSFARSFAVEMLYGDNQRTFMVEVYNPYYILTDTPATP